MRKLLSVLWPFLLAGLGGLLLALCFAPFNLPDLVWLAPVCLLAAVWLGVGDARCKRKGFLVGLIAGLVFWAVNLKWLGTVAGGAYLILAGYLAVYFAFFGLFAASVGNPFRGASQARGKKEVALRSLGFAALNAGLWCGLEWVRGHVLTGFGWNGLGAAFHSRLPLAQGAELVGVAGLAFLPIFVAGVVVQVGVRLVKGTRAGKMERHWDFAVMVLLLFGCFIYGIFRMTAINRAPSDELRVVLVQMDIPQVAGTVLWTGEEVHEAYESETLAALARVDARNEKLVAEAEGEVELETVDWVVWPEVVLYGALLDAGEGAFVLYEPSLAADTIEKMRAAGVRNFVAGITELEAERVEGGLRIDEDATEYNSLLAIDANGDMATHRKQHLVIYGEYIPFVDSLKWLGDIYEKVAGVPWTGNMGRGTGSDGFTLPGAGGEVRVLPSICFEDTVPRVVRKFSKGPREVILNITNDGWFGESEGSQQHFDNALFRAIELRRPLLRAANRGVTGAVSATGSLVDYETGERQTLQDEQGRPFQRGSVFVKAQVLSEGGPTLYARLGDWFSALGLGVALSWGVMRWRVKE